VAHRWGARLIFASTAVVHGVKTSRIDADAPMQLDTAYARSKSLGEQLIAASGVDHCILRIAGIFGLQGPVHLGINRAIDGACGATAPRQVGTGKSLRNYVYVHDVAAAIGYVLENTVRGTHLLAGDDTLSISEMLAAICAKLAPQLNPVVVDGDDAADQLIAPSPLLPRTRTFAEALDHITALRGLSL